METLMRLWLKRGLTSEQFGDLVKFTLHYLDTKEVPDPATTDEQVMDIFLEYRIKMNKLIIDRNARKRKKLAKEGVTV